MSSFCDIGNITMLRAAFLYDNFTTTFSLRSISQSERLSALSSGLVYCTFLRAFRHGLFWLAFFRHCFRPEFFAVFLTSDLIRFFFGEKLYAVFLTAFPYKNSSTSFQIASVFRSSFLRVASPAFFSITLLTSISKWTFFVSCFLALFRSTLLCAFFWTRMSMKYFFENNFFALF